MLHWALLMARDASQIRLSCENMICRMKKKTYLTFEKHVTNSKIILNIEMKICGKCFDLKSPYRLAAIGISAASRNNLFGKQRRYDVP